MSQSQPQEPARNRAVAAVVLQLMPAPSRWERLVDRVEIKIDVAACLKWLALLITALAAPSAIEKLEKRDVVASAETAVIRTAEHTVTQRMGVEGANRPQPPPR